MLILLQMLFPALSKTLLSFPTSFMPTSSPLPHPQHLPLPSHLFLTEQPSLCFHLNLLHWSLIALNYHYLLLNLSCHLQVFLLLPSQFHNLINVASQQRLCLCMRDVLQFSSSSICSTSDSSIWLAISSLDVIVSFLNWIAVSNTSMCSFNSTSLHKHQG